MALLEHSPGHSWQDMLHPRSWPDVTVSFMLLPPNSPWPLIRSFSSQPHCSSASIEPHPTLSRPDPMSTQRHSSQTPANRPQAPRTLPTEPAALLPKKQSLLILGCGTNTWQSLLASLCSWFSCPNHHLAGDFWGPCHLCFLLCLTPPACSPRTSLSMSSGHRHFPVGHHQPLSTAKAGVLHGAFITKARTTAEVLQASGGGLTSFSLCAHCALSQCMDGWQVTSFFLPRLHSSCLLLSSSKLTQHSDHMCLASHTAFSSRYLIYTDKPCLTRF